MCKTSIRINVLSNRRVDRWASDAYISSKRSCARACIRSCAHSPSSHGGGVRRRPPPRLGTLLAELLGRYPQLKTNILREMTAHMDDADAAARACDAESESAAGAYAAAPHTALNGDSVRGPGGPALPDASGARGADGNDTLHREPYSHQLGSGRTRALWPREDRGRRRRGASGRCRSCRRVESARRSRELRTGSAVRHRTRARASDGSRARK
jgi:hypothetical protein